MSVPVFITKVAPDVKLTERADDYPVLHWLKWIRVVLSLGITPAYLQADVKLLLPESQNRTTPNTWFAFGSLVEFVDNGKYINPFLF